ncbi:MAG: hypothetical protein ACPLRX_02585, partial [Candidatus Saccharicenans sp.]
MRIKRLVKAVVILANFLTLAFPGRAFQAGERWVHPAARALEITRKGPFVLMPDGALATVDDKGFSLSYDRGKTWSEPVFVCRGINPAEPASYYLLRTR